MSRYNTFLKAANVVAYLLVIFVNCLVGVDKDKPVIEPEPGNNNTLSFTFSHNLTEHHLLPATFTFGIWGLIYPLLGGFVIYQWFDAAEAATVEGIQYYHVVASILNVTWLLIWVSTPFRIF